MNNNTWHLAWKYNPCPCPDCQSVPHSRSRANFLCVFLLLGLYGVRWVRWLLYVSLRIHAIFSFVAESTKRYKRYPARPLPSFLLAARAIIATWNVGQKFIYIYYICICTYICVPRQYLHSVLNEKSRLSRPEYLTKKKKRTHSQKNSKQTDGLMMNNVLGLLYFCHCANI